MRKAILAVAVLAGAAAVRGGEAVSWVWDFKDGPAEATSDVAEVGARAFDAENNPVSATADELAFAKGTLHPFVNDRGQAASVHVAGRELLLGRHLLAGGKQLAEDLKYVRFIRPDTSNDQPNSTLRFGSGLAAKMTDGGAWTLEFQCYAPEQAGPNKVLLDLDIGDRVRVMQNNGTAVTLAVNDAVAVNQTWHCTGWMAVALTYEPGETAGAGRVSLWVERRKAGEAEVNLGAPTREWPVSFGQERQYVFANSPFAATRLAGLRFTKRALGAGELAYLSDLGEGETLPAGRTVAFYDFREYGPGAKMDQVSNRVARADGGGWLNAQVTTLHKCGVTFFKPHCAEGERPGRYVFSDKGCAEVVAENPNSAKGGAYAIRFDSLAEALGRGGEFTVEFFLQGVVAGNLWHNLFGADFGGGEIAGFADGTSGLAVTTNADDLTDAGAMLKVGEALAANDRVWHHAAVAFGGGKVKFYLNYQEAGDGAGLDYAAGTAAADGMRRLDFWARNIMTNTYSAMRMTCLRATTAMLGPEGFMRVADVRRPYARTVGATAGYWPLDGEAGTTLWAGEAFHGVKYRSLALASGDNQNFVHSDETCGRERVVIGGEYVGKNGGSARVSGEQGKWGGFYLMNTANKMASPESFTVETFFKAAKLEGTGINLFEMVNPANPGAWDIYFGVGISSGTPRKLWFRRNMTEAGYKQGVAGDWEVGEGEWHHLAFSYDRATLECKFWVDYREVHRETLPGPLKREANGFWRFGYGFDGWLDELRVSEGALEAKDFIRLCNPAGMVLMVR